MKQGREMVQWESASHVSIRTRVQIPRVHTVVFICNPRAGKEGIRGVWIPGDPGQLVCERPCHRKQCVKCCGTHQILISGL